MPSIATDSQANVYAAETFEGRRVRKFVNRGLAPVEAAELGVVWPE